MKKMLIIAAVAICAAVSQAAQVSWSASNVNKAGTNLDKGTITGYMFDSAVVSVAQVTAAIADGTFSTLAGQAFGNQGTSNVAAGAISGAAAFVDGNTYKSGTSVTTFAVIFDNASVSKASNYIITATKTMTMKGSGITAFGFGTQASNNKWTAVPVPEPCSVALLALGLAAFGLKRKVA